MRHGDILKPLMSFGVAVALAVRAKAHRPVIPFFPGQYDLPGRIGRNRKRGNIRYRQMQFFRASPGVGSFVAGPQPHLKRVPDASTGHSVCAIEDQRSPVKHELRCRLLIGFARAVPPTAGKQGAKEDQDTGGEKAHRGTSLLMIEAQKHGTVSWNHSGRTTTTLLSSEGGRIQPS